MGSLGAVHRTSPASSAAYRAPSEGHEPRSGRRRHRVEVDGLVDGLVSRHTFPCSVQGGVGGGKEAQIKKIKTVQRPEIRRGWCLIGGLVSALFARGLVVLIRSSHHCRACALYAVPARVFRDAVLQVPVEAVGNIGSIVFGDVRR